MIFLFSLSCTRNKILIPGMQYIFGIFFATEIFPENCSFSLSFRSRCRNVKRFFVSLICAPQRVFCSHDSLHYALGYATLKKTQIRVERRFWCPVSITRWLRITSHHDQVPMNLILLRLQASHYVYFWVLGNKCMICIFIRFLFNVLSHS